MLKLIIHPSTLLLNCLLSLCLTLSKPQQLHVVRTVEALIVSDGRKTLANLYRQWVEAPDVSAVSDFYRVSPWSGEEMGQALMQFVITDLIRRGEAEGVQSVIYTSLDDSLSGKDKDTTALEGVDWHHFANGILRKIDHFFILSIKETTLLSTAFYWDFTFTQIPKRLVDGVG